MVFSTNDYETSNNEDSGSGRLLRDIEEISRALYLHNTPSRTLFLPSEYQSRHADKVVVQDVLHKNKKSSIWKWKPLKALSHIRDHRFNCCFFLHVHGIEGLSSNFNDLTLCVNWKRKDEVLRTRPVRVVHGIVEFEETLMHRCSVYGSRNGPQNSAKYEPKLFLLHASVIGAPALDIGKHWVDLARLLPLTFEELDEEKRTSGKWTTSFKLKGKAKGAMLNVSFGFSILGDNPFGPSDFAKVADITKQNELTTIDHMADYGRTSSDSSLRRLGSVPRMSADEHRLSSQSMDIKFLDDIFCNRKSELAQSITFLCQKLDDEKFGTSEEFEFFHERHEPLNLNTAPSTELTSGDTGLGLEDTDFAVVDQGIETSIKDELKVHDSHESFDSSVVETIDIAEILQEDLTSFSENLESNTGHKFLGNSGCESIRDSKEENGVHDKELSIEDPKIVLHDLLTSESADMNLSPYLSNSIDKENFMIRKPSYREGKIVRSLSLDDVMESVANDFLGILGIEQTAQGISSDDEPESPRERLLKQFEKECWGFGDSVLELNAVGEPMEFSNITSTGNGRVACSDDFDLSLVIQEVEKEHSRVNQSLRSRRNAQKLENLETEALMQRWGLNEKAFQNSPRFTSGGFGSPVYLAPEEPSELLPLGEGLGPVIQTKTGGFICSMNSRHFKNAKNGAKLIVQISNPVVLPAVMGSNVMEILQSWASEGAEKMFIQANELMPLEDITGMTMHQVMQEADSCAEVFKRWAYLRKFKAEDYSFGDKNSEELQSFENFENINSCSISHSMSSDYVSLEDLVPLAVTKIEALSIEGLRIQSGLSDEEAPSSTRPELSRNWASITENVKLGVMSFLGANAMQLLDLNVGNYVDELIKLSLPLDEWIKFDAGDLDYDHEIDGRSLKILATHHTNLFDLDRVQLQKDSEPVKVAGSGDGLLGNNFTLALRLQLRDPFRDYEMVGASMLALAQVERVWTPLGREMFSTKSETNSNHREDDLNEELVNDGSNDEVKEERMNKLAVPQFKISEVHVIGRNVEPNDKQPLNTRRQIQSGSRWLLSSGMNKMGKKRFSSSHAIIKSSAQMLKKRPGDVLWSISSHVQCAAAKWKELSALNIHVRKPDIILTNEPIRFLKVQDTVSIQSNVHSSFCEKCNFLGCVVHRLTT